jgi:DNA-binding transcriptional MerR regulator
MDKSPDAFRTISEVAETLDVPPHVLRFWETRFAQVKPVKRGGGRRYYRPEDVRLLRGIRGLLYDDGLTIKGVQKILREKGTRHVIGLGEATEDTPPKRAKARRVASRSAATEPRVVPNGRAPAPALQPDLFTDVAPNTGPSVPQSETSRSEAPPDGGGAKPLDRTALRALVAELEALRAVMTADLRAG